MKKLMFYCQHILGMGHLVRSMEIVRGLTQYFEVCFINGGEIVPGFVTPPNIQIINLPAIKTDTEFKELQLVDNTQSLEAVQELRREQLLLLFEQIQPDCLIIELFPFGRRRFSFELIPLLEQAKKQEKTRIICSLRDIVVNKQDQNRHEEKVCKLINKYFDMVLIHGDPQFQTLEESFSRVCDLKCAVHYTGYVVQNLEDHVALVEPQLKKPLILVSVGGGRFGHELLECTILTAAILRERIPHQILMFAGPFIPNEKYAELRTLAADYTNLEIYRYTPNLLKYMKEAELSISMAGYNTTMNVLTTNVKAMMLPFTGNDDQEQTFRAKKLEKLGIIDVIDSEDLVPEVFANKIINCLSKQANKINFDLAGVAKSAYFIHQLFDVPCLVENKT